LTASLFPRHSTPTKALPFPLLMAAPTARILLATVSQEEAITEVLFSSMP
jgi:hypothetical protein